MLRCLRDLLAGRGSIPQRLLKWRLAKGAIFYRQSVDQFRRCLSLYREILMLGFKRRYNRLV